MKYRRPSEEMIAGIAKGTPISILSKHFGPWGGTVQAEVSPPAHVSASIRWTRILDGVWTLEMFGPTEADAWQELLVFAHDLGWTPPQWWQVWRWCDTRLPPQFKHLYTKES